MPTSILQSTKKILGLDSGYEAFDADITVFINSALSILDQVGVGPEGGFFIENADQNWEDLNLPDNQLNLVRTYLFLKVRMLFDPPNTSFVLNAFEEQLKEYEYRLHTFAEMELP